MLKNRTAVLLSFMIALLLAAPAAAQNAGAQTLSKLTKPISINVEDTRFEDVVAFIKASTGATIDIAWTNNRHPDGIDKDALVSISIDNAQSLAVLLHAANQAMVDDFDSPTWQLDQQTGALQVGPRSRLNKFKRLEIYDIQDMTFVLPDYEDVPQLNLNSVIRQGQGGGGGGILQQAVRPHDARTQDEEAVRIMEILRLMIEVEQWQANGGDGALVRIYEGNLLVSAPDYIHRQINGYSFLPGPIGRPPVATAQADESELEQAEEQTAAETKSDQ